jgi:hypothetical protein
MDMKYIIKQSKDLLKLTKRINKALLLAPILVFAWNSLVLSCEEEIEIAGEIYCDTDISSTNRGDGIDHEFISLTTGFVSDTIFIAVSTARSNLSLFVESSGELLGSFPLNISTNEFLFDVPSSVSPQDTLIFFVGENLRDKKYWLSVTYKPSELAEALNSINSMDFTSLLQMWNQLAEQGYHSDALRAALKLTEIAENDNEAFHAVLAIALSYKHLGDIPRMITAISGFQASYPTLNENEIENLLKLFF